MFDESDEQRVIEERLVRAVTGALGGRPSFDGLRVSPSGRVVVVNGIAGEERAWRDSGRSIVGPDVRVTFVARSGGIRSTGVGMVAARGRGTLDFQRFDCGCRAAQIPGEDEWQLIRGSYCRFAASDHQLGAWPVDSIVRPV